MCLQIRICAGKFHLFENQFLLVQESATFQNKPFCTFGQNVATLDRLVRSQYPQLHGIANLIQILQGGLEILLLSWRTFILTDLHSPVHLCATLGVCIQSTLCLPPPWWLTSYEKHSLKRISEEEKIYKILAGLQFIL